MAQFTPHQDAALKAVGDWLDARPGKNGTPPVFRLFGYAGTGKTTLARHIADGVDGEVKYAAFTGKAALVMRNKGCDGASTIHSLIYRARESGEEQPNFELWDDAPASKARLIVIDECSMVDADLGRDLMSFDCPLLVLGDPAQLPPIQGGGFFTNDAPDAMLTEVHRQAQDDPIVRMSMAVREGRPLEAGQFGESEVVRRDSLDQLAALNQHRLDQVGDPEIEARIAQYNKLRKAAIESLGKLGAPARPTVPELEKLSTDPIFAEVAKAAIARLSAGAP